MLYAIRAVFYTKDLNTDHKRGRLQQQREEKQVCAINGKKYRDFTYCAVVCNLLTLSNLNPEIHAYILCNLAD
jgi:hypothetical protein